MIKKALNKLVVTLLVVSLVLSVPITASAADNVIQKDENVYAILNQDGQVNHIYVVNSFEVGSEATITDYGDYESLRNLTNTNELLVQNGKINSTISKGRFYYQGNLVSKALPWNIEINYKLDSQEIDPADLIGQSGEVELSIKVSQNKEVGEEFFNHYSMQISTSLDGDKFYNITAEDATVANAGNNKSINFTLLPGNEKTFIIKAEVENFELNPIQFNGVLLAMDISLDGVDGITEDFTKLTDGIQELNNGVVKLNEGSESYYTGISSLADNTGTITNSSNAIEGAISTTSNGLADLLKSSEQLKALANTMLASTDPQSQVFAQGYLSQVEALEQISFGLSALSEQYKQFDSGLLKLSDGIQSLTDGYKALNNGIGTLSDGTKELYDNTAGMDTKINSKIDSMLSDFSNDDFKPVSFVSPKNINVGIVQFVLRTDSLKVPETTVVVEEEKPSLTFWQKLLDLFGLYQED